MLLIITMNPYVLVDMLQQMKDEIALRKQKNLAELAEVDDITRIEMEGYRGGTYLRLELHSMPYEMVQYFDPTIPLLVGGLGLGEEAVGFMQVLQPSSSP